MKTLSLDSSTGVFYLMVKEEIILFIYERLLENRRKYDF